MHPELFHIGEITIYSYAFCIVVGTVIATRYTKWRARKELGIKTVSNNFFYLIFVAGFVGGKLFYYLEKPIYFMQNPSLMLQNFSGGFVFYGSFVIIIPTVIWYLKKHKIPVFPMLDILAITTLIVHAIGRLGCFLGGCCYGKPTDSFTGMIFPSTNGVSVHPSQLYEITALLIILVFVLSIKKRKQFNGQIFLTYLILYASARIFLEFFRGDSRGFIIEGMLSHSQCIGLLLIILATIIYKKINTHQKIIYSQT